MNRTKFRRRLGSMQFLFIVLIDKEGRIIARNLRGEKVREAILKVINN